MSELRKGYLSAREEVNKLKKRDPDGAAKAFAERFEPTARSYVAAVQEVAQASAPSWTLPSANDEPRFANQRAAGGVRPGFLLLGLVLSWYLSPQHHAPLKAPWPKPAPATLPTSI